MSLFLIDKRVGETPLEATERLRSTNSIPSTTPMTYAGRLDPMAEGLLLILSGDDCKIKDKLLYLPKSYDAMMLLGVQTDSGDILGHIEQISTDVVSNCMNTERLSQIVTGEHNLSVPHYSSVIVDGKPLHEWTRAGVKKPTPSRSMTVTKATVYPPEQIPTHELLQNINERISRVHGDFRQSTILAHWQNAHLPEPCLLMRFTCDVKGGTYIRSLISLIQDELKLPATLYSLKRTAIGPFTLANSQS